MEGLEERRQAELDFVKSAYGPEEAWVVPSTGSSSSSLHSIHRRLELHESCNIELVLTLPRHYPVKGELEVDASIIHETSSATRSNGSSAHQAVRKLALSALPGLLAACRQVARELQGEEAIFAVLSSADEWLQDGWQQMLLKKEGSGQENTLDHQHGNAIPTSSVHKQLRLGRRLIYSHHIISSVKRKSIIEMAPHYNLGGYMKIGWPGIIVIEGAEEDCLHFVEEIRRMRWQYLVVRGEEQEDVQDVSDLDSCRKLPKRFEELAEDEMSALAQCCREAGLEDLFLTAMKVYSRNQDQQDTEIENDPSLPMLDSCYGVLVKIDHMNERKKYGKWLHKAARDAACHLLLKQCFPSDDENKKRPVIVVGIVGEEKGVKLVMKRWRTSRVDVDSKGRPCLERMLTVLVEGPLDAAANPDWKHDTEDEFTISCEHLGRLLAEIGGDEWSDSFQKIPPS